MTPKLSINLVGSGKVGQTLLRLIADTGRYAIGDIYNPRLERAKTAAQFIGAGRAISSLSEMRPADLWIITVPDTKIADLAMELAKELASERGYPPSCAVHCSGFLPAAAMEPLGLAGWKLASAHPMFSFADPAIGIGKFDGSYCGLEGNAQAIEIIEPLFEAIGGIPFPVTTKGKALCHGAAVFASNLNVVLQMIAQDAWREAGVPDGVINELHAGILRSTTENVLALGPEDALTGPAARNDWSVVEQQHNAIHSWHPEAANAYLMLSRLARRLKQTGTTLPEVEDEHGGE